MDQFFCGCDRPRFLSYCLSGYERIVRRFLSKKQALFVLYMIIGSLQQSGFEFFGRDFFFVQVTAMRRRQESARRRLADAFSAMSAYIQRYRCQESEFDLGAALMNPMADCESALGFF